MWLHALTPVTFPGGHNGVSLYSANLLFRSPLQELSSQFLLAGQAELVLTGGDVVTCGQGDFHQALFFCLQRTIPMVGFSPACFTLIGQSVIDQFGAGFADTVCDM